MDPVKRCKKCIIPSSYEGVSFDEEGVCNFCANYKKCPPRLGRDKLLALINSVPRGKVYDCVVPLSGGKDSTFILYYAVKELKLRVIAISYDSGFQSPIARRNMQRACGKLNVPLVIENTGNLKKIMLRDGFFLKKYGVPIPICENCETILRSICIRISRKFGIPFVLWGSSSLESYTSKAYEEYRNRGRRAIRLISEPVKVRLSLLIRAVYAKIRLLKMPVRDAVRPFACAIMSVYQRLLMGVPLRYVLGRGRVVPFSDGPVRFIHFYDYVEWDSINNIKLLKDILQWEHPERKKDRFDCRLHCFGNYFYLRKYGISQDGFNFCNFIRENKMTREEALEQEEYIGTIAYKECEEVAEEIGVKDFLKYY